MVTLCEYCGLPNDSADCFYYCMGSPGSADVINVTPHVIDVFPPGAVSGRRFPISGHVARVSVTYTDDGTLEGFPVRKATYGEITGLPEPDGRTTYIVSSIVLAAAKAAGRTDCVAPDTAAATRNDAGHIISVPGFVR